MYRTVSNVGEQIKSAEQYVLDHDRANYSPFFETAEKFCAEHSVIIGDKIGTELLLGIPLSKDSFEWCLYTENAFALAKTLAHRLKQTRAPHVPIDYITVETNIPDKELHICVNVRRLFIVYGVERYRGKRVIDLIPIIKTKGYFGNQIIVPSANYQLIDICQTLYTPAKFDNWAKYAQLFKQLTSGTPIVVGGAREQCPDKRFETVLIEDVVNPNGYVAIGDFAIAELTQCNACRVQFIVDAPIADVARAIMRAFAYKAGSKITYNEYQLCNISDFRLSKYTFYLVSGEKQLPIADVFNSACFELVPFWQGKKIKKIANPFVLLRFCYIDLWMLIILRALGTQGLDDKMRVIESNIARMVVLVDSTPTEKLFQMVDYYGVYTDANVAKKRHNKVLGFRPTYFASGGGCVGTSIESDDIYIV